MLIKSLLVADKLVDRVMGPSLYIPVHAGACVLVYWYIGVCVGVSCEKKYRMFQLTTILI